MKKPNKTGIKHIKIQAAAARPVSSFGCWARWRELVS